MSRQIGPSERLGGRNEAAGGGQVVVLCLRLVSIMDPASQLAIDCPAQHNNCPRLPAVRHSSRLSTCHGETGEHGAICPPPTDTVSRYVPISREPTEGMSEEEEHPLPSVKSTRVQSLLLLNNNRIMCYCYSCCCSWL